MPHHETWEIWSGEDDYLLQEWSGHKPVHVIAHLLGRSVTAVQQRAAKKGLSLCFNRTWDRVTTKEVKRVKELAKNYDSKSAAARGLGMKRSRLVYLLNLEL